MQADVGDELVEQVFSNDVEYTKALELLIEQARTNFLIYIHLFNPQGHSPYKLGKLHRYLIQLVQDVVDDNTSPNNAVSVPPQHGKSTLLSVEAPSWILGVKPKAQIAITGFSSTLVTGFSKQIRARMGEDLYQEVFPGIRPLRGSNRMDLWETTKGGGVVAKPSGSKLTGRRVDYLVLDDVHAGRAEAESVTMRAKVVEWYWADCVTRLHPKAKQFLVGTRWHPDDLIGNLTSDTYNEQLDSQDQGQLKFRYTNIPAISEEGIPDPLGREPGEALFPEERPLSYLKGLKAALPSYEWDSQYQGQPRGLSSGLIDLSCMHYLMPEEIPWDNIDEIVRGWDLALSEAQTADYTTGALLGINYRTKEIYILHMVKRRMSWGKMRVKISMQAILDKQGYAPEGRRPKRKHKVMRQGIEGVTGFKIAVEEFRKELLGQVKIELKNPPPRSEGGGSKLLRAQPWLVKLEKGLVHCVRGDWTKDFIDELESFPDGLHDDQVDAVSIGHEMVERRKTLLVA